MRTGGRSAYVRATMGFLRLRALSVGVRCVVTAKKPSQNTDSVAACLGRSLASSLLLPTSMRILVVVAPSQSPPRQRIDSNRVLRWFLIGDFRTLVGAASAAHATLDDRAAVAAPTSSDTVS
jgi:hypothetical protein